MVGVATEIRLDVTGLLVRFHAGATAQQPDRLWGPRSFLLHGHDGIFPPGRNLKTHPYLVLSLP